MRRDHVLSLALGFLLFIGYSTSEAFAQESASAIAVGPGAEVTLSGEIRWKKTLGTVPYTTGISDAHSDPCSAFHVLVLTADQDQTLVKYQDDLAWKLKAGEFNVCKFILTVPSNIPIRVYPAMGKKNSSSEQQEQLYLRKGWAGGEKIPNDGHYGWFDKTRNQYPGNLIDPQPKTGYHRGFAPRYSQLTLARSTFVAFEMVYEDNFFRPYPQYTNPPPPQLKPPYITAGQPVVPPFLAPASVYLGWDGGPDHPNVQVWLSIDHGTEIPAFSLDFAQQSPLWKLPKAGGEMKLQRFHYYKYALKDAAGKTLSTVGFVVP